MLYALPASGFAGQAVTVTVAVTNLAPWLAGGGMLGAAAAMVGGGPAPNATVTAVALTAGMAAAVTVELHGAADAAGEANVTLVLLPASSALVRFAFNWLPADLPVVSDFEPMS